MVLVLNSAYIPLNSISWKRAICLIYQEKADVIYEKDKILHSPSVEMKMPSVIRLKNVDFMPHVNIKYNKRNVYLRDNYICQYCGKKPQLKDLTIDHVVPKTKGGQSVWTNIVACCSKCNLRKGDKTPKQAGMSLLALPKKPYYYPYLLIKKCANESDLEVWKQFFVI